LLKSIGDILPDQSDDCRYKLVEHRVSYYQSLVESCPECHATGVVEVDGKQKTCKCKKSLKIIIELLKSNFPQQHFSIIKDELFPRKYVEIDTDTGEFDGKARDFTESFLTPFTKNKRFVLNNSCSCLFYGNNESGKTYSALYMLYDFISHDISGHYLRFKNYLNLLNSSYNNPDDKTVLRQIRDVKLLVIDELGKEHGKTEYATCELEELIKHRQDNLSSTILITNLDYKDFVATYGNHVKSAFNKNFKILLFNPDNNFRKKTRISWPK
jgi:DNA replication protein DnaC